MILKMMQNVQTANDEEYKEILRKKNIWNLIGAFVGVITLLVVFLVWPENVTSESAFISGVYSGIGSAVIVIGVAAFFITRKNLKNDQKIHEMRIKNQDERNTMIVQKSVQYASAVLLIGIYAALLVSAPINLTVFWTLWVLAIAYAVIFLIVKIILEKRN